MPPVQEILKVVDVPALVATQANEPDVPDPPGPPDTVQLVVLDEVQDMLTESPAFTVTGPFEPLALISAVEVVEVVKERTEPYPVPALLLAIAQYQYVVNKARPSTVCEYVTAVVPEPRGLLPVAVPKMLLHVPGSVVL